MTPPAPGTGVPGTPAINHRSTLSVSNVCHGGPNDGMGCTPADSPQNATFPTTHDCPPPAPLDIGGLPIAFPLTTGTTSKTGQTISGQGNVICGYCRDVNSTFTGCFEGDPAGACPVSSGGAHACSSNADCAEPFESCEQRNAGAFKFATARSITETGSPAGAIATGGAPASATLVSVFCIPPTFNGIIDSVGGADLPGPGAAGLLGQVQLLP